MTMSVWLNEFKTMQDPVLQKMASEAVRFVDDMRSKQPPRWLSFVGPSGVGKTFLANLITSQAMKMPHLTTHWDLKCGACFAFWPKVLSDLRNAKFHLMSDLSDAHFLFLDEVVVEHDPNGFGQDKLSELFSRRANKWTVITSNKTVAQLSSIDRRIASRMVRGESVVVGCETIDYAMRA